MLSHHARERCAEMGLSTKQVKRALEHVEMTYPSTDYDGNPVKVSVADGLAIVHNDEGTVITVLWHGREGRTT